MNVSKVLGHGRRLILAILIAMAATVFLPDARAQYTAPYVGLVGTLGSANGMPAANYVITINPSQVMYVGGTSLVVSGATCATDTDGNVIGMANPLTPPSIAWNPSSGTLPPGNYYIEVTWYDSFSHQTLPTAEQTAQLSAAGNIQISPPAGGAPASAAGMDVYIGTSSGAETYQGQTANPASTFTQSVPLVAGAAPPIANNSACVVVANDAAWPIGGYSFTIITPAGNTVPGFPQQVQFIGPGSAYNLTNGLPQWNGRVTYPVPILTIPYNHNAQSISGSLSMTNYNLYNVGRVGVGTANPAWGVDVEGSGAGAAINANQGYLLNGLAGQAGQALCSDGTYFDQACTFQSVQSLYYQSVTSNGTAETQRPTLNFSSRFALLDSGSPASTNVDLAPSGVTAGSYSKANIVVDSYGRVTSASNGGASSSLTNCLITACAAGSTYTSGVQYTNSSGHALVEMVSIHGYDSTGGCTGPSGMLTGIVNGASVLYTEINNDCNTANISGFTLVVPIGATFQANIMTIGSPSTPYLLYSWYEMGL